MIVKLETLLIYSHKLRFAKLARAGKLWSHDVIQQKLNYIHNNPVDAGFVAEPEHWRFSSAIDYGGGKGLIEILYL